jgi:hypothetical protein
VTTAEPVVYASGAVKNGLGTIAAPNKFSCTYYRRYGTYVIVMILRVMILQLRKLPMASYFSLFHQQLYLPNAVTVQCGSGELFRTRKFAFCLILEVPTPLSVLL